MKITTGEKETGQPITSYPNVGISKHSGLVVLFNEAKSGIVLVGDSIFSVGQYRTGFAMDAFVVCTEPITIQGEE